ncbi:MAG: ZIP family metal transporter [Bacteroidota bacterium]|jgi:zinc and cadmium transporter
MVWWLSCVMLFVPVFLSGLVVFSFHFTEKKLKLILSFSGAYILALSLLHLFPELYEGQDPQKIGIYILSGFFIQLLLEFFSTGIEHGHAHLHSKDHKIPFSVLAGLFVHSMLEGMPVSQHASVIQNGSALNFSDSLVVGIILHNIPISIAFTGMLLHNGMSRRKALAYLLLFSLMAPVGCFITQVLQWSGFSEFEQFQKISLAVVIGIFLHISTTIMFESSEKNHKYQLSKILAIITGAGVAWLLS